MKYFKKIMLYFLEIVVLFVLVFLFVEKDIYNSIKYCILYMVFMGGTNIIKKFLLRRKKEKTVK